MGLITLLRGFKVPIVVLDRFLEAQGVEPTWGGIPPQLFERSRDTTFLPEVDPQSAFFRAKLAASASAAAPSDNNPDPGPAPSLDQVRLFIPRCRGHGDSAYGYVAYAFVMVYAQRHVDLAAELPEQAPPGFAELRREVLAFATEEEQPLLQVAGMQDAGGESAFFTVFTEEREFPFERPFVTDVSEFPLLLPFVSRLGQPPILFLELFGAAIEISANYRSMSASHKSDLRCRQCAAEFETYSELYVHRTKVHGLVGSPLPDDL
jgi:hypothetical protein